MPFARQLHDAMLADLRWMSQVVAADSEELNVPDISNKIRLGLFRSWFAEDPVVAGRNSAVRRVRWITPQALAMRSEPIAELRFLDW